MPLRSCPLSTICAPSAAVAVLSGLPAARSAEGGRQVHTKHRAIASVQVLSLWCCPPSSEAAISRSQQQYYWQRTSVLPLQALLLLLLRTSSARQQTAEGAQPALPVQQPTFAERVDGINHIEARHHLACMPCQSRPAARAGQQRSARGRCGAATREGQEWLAGQPFIPQGQYCVQPDAARAWLPARPALP